MTRKGKLIIVIVALFAMVIISLLIYLFRSGRIRFHAATEPVVINNTATVQYCREGDTTATCDPANNKYTYQTNSNTVSVIVNNADTTPPTVSLTAPANGATLTGTATVAATASDDVGISKVELTRCDSSSTTSCNNAQILSTVTASPFSYAWNTTSSTNGQYKLMAKAYDTSSNSADSALVSVTVNNTTTSVVFKITPENRNTASGCPVISSGGTIKITPTVAPTPVNATLAADCTISFSPTGTITPGTYSIELDLPTYLKRTVSATLPSATPIDLGTFIAGDFDNNDCVNITDWNYLKTKWDAVLGGANWDAAYDLKGNGYIGIDDYGILAGRLNTGHDDPGGLCPRP